MEKVGFFGGSFNPPTNAHLEIAKTALEEMELDKVYFVPMGNTYKKPGLIDERLSFNNSNSINAERRAAFERKAAERKNDSEKCNASYRQWGSVPRRHENCGRQNSRGRKKHQWGRKPLSQRKACISRLY